LRRYRDSAGIFGEQFSKPQVEEMGRCPWSFHVAAAAVAIGLGIAVSTAALADTPEIAFTSEFSGGLYVMDAQTLSVKRKSLGLTTIEDLAYSSSSKTLALIGSRGKDGQRSLFLLKWPGTKVQLIAYPKEGAPYRPEFDPEGRFLYAVNYGSEVFRYSLKGGEWARVPVQGIQDLHVQEIAVSPSGHLAALSPADFKGFLIAEVAPEHFRVLRAVVTDFNSCTSAHWIDDSHIVFLGRKSEGYQSVWQLDLGSGQLRQLTHPPLGTRDFLSLSGDGRSVVFTGSDTISPAVWTLWRLDLTAKDPVRLIPGKQDSSFLFPAWID
jgi:Tol biopolymer transport system component